VFLDTVCYYSKSFVRSLAVTSYVKVVEETEQLFVGQKFAVCVDKCSVLGYRIQTKHQRISLLSSVCLLYYVRVPFRVCPQKL